MCLFALKDNLQLNLECSYYNTILALYLKSKGDFVLVSFLCAPVDVSDDLKKDLVKRWLVWVWWGKRSIFMWVFDRISLVVVPWCSGDHTRFTLFRSTRGVLGSNPRGTTRFFFLSSFFFSGFLFPGFLFIIHKALDEFCRPLGHCPLHARLSSHTGASFVIWPSVRQ